uniref:Retrotransposon gag domain-containing protein n=1 Tax=Ananas comosus var. bracteatus TaxID=296719 RepID=A0A6V7Q977_ANACO|nr:unnamed protein product [Ananas comosus var. bracteatus]
MLSVIKTQPDQMMALQEEIRGLKAMQSSDPRDPLEAESWLQEMEKALTHMGIGGETQVTFVTYMLREGAYEWWKSVRDGHSDKTQSWTWKEFCKIFYDKYFPDSIRRAKKAEFVHLEQSNRTVIEYELEFTRLERFAPKLVEFELERARKFEEGLRPDIRQLVVGYELPTLRDVVNKALLLEKELQRTQSAPAISELSRTQAPPSQSSSGGASGRRDNRKSRNGGARQRNGGRLPRPQPKDMKCDYCGGPHRTNRCRWESGACFECGSFEHKIANCPVKKQKRDANHQQSAGASTSGMTPQGPHAQRLIQNWRDSSGSGQTSQARAYAMTQQDGSGGADVLTGFAECANLVQ